MPPCHPPPPLPTPVYVSLSLSLSLSLSISLFISLSIYLLSAGFFLSTRQRHSQIRKEYHCPSHFTCPVHTIDVRRERNPSAAKINGKIYELINGVCRPWIERPEWLPHCRAVTHHIAVRFRRNRSRWFWHGSGHFASRS